MNTDLVTNSRATRWMLRRIWRPSCDHPRHLAELAARRARGRRPSGPSACPQPCAIASRACLSAGTSLTPSPSIADVAPGLGERAARPRACPRARCARPRARPAPPRAARRRASGRRLAVERAGAAGHAGVAGDRADGGRRVAGERPSAPTSCSAKNATVSAAFGAQPLRQDDEAERPHAARAAARRARPAGSGASGAAEREHAAPPCAASSGALLAQVGVGAGEALRRAEHEPLAAEVERAPAPPRGERHLRGRLDGGVAVGQRRRRGPPRGSGCATARSRRSRPSARASCGLVDPVGGHELDHAQRRLGQRAGLVGAHDVHRRQRLDRVELLREHAALGDLERRDRRGQADTSRISPSGTRLTIPAVSVSHALRPGSTSRSERDAERDRERHRDRRRGRAAAGPSPRSSGERGWRNARAVAVSRAARLSAPTAVAS